MQLFYFPLFLDEMCRLMTLCLLSWFVVVLVVVVRHSVKEVGSWDAVLLTRSHAGLAAGVHGFRLVFERKRMERRVNARPLSLPDGGDNFAAGLGAGTRPCCAGRQR